MKMHDDLSCTGCLLLIALLVLAPWLANEIGEAWEWPLVWRVALAVLLGELGYVAIGELAREEA